MREPQRRRLPGDTSSTMELPEEIEIRTLDAADETRHELDHEAA
jgi:hypothetical protein